MTRQRMFLDINCVEAARQRIRHVYDTFDTVCVQFSGGKDSTAILYLAKEVHEERGLGPVKVIFRDEEMVSPLVIKYIEEVRNYDWVDMEWYCLGGETEVITRQGTKKISDLAGGEHELMTERGKWVKAPVRSFGNKEVQKLTLQRAGITKEIIATPDHRWYIKTRKMDNGQRVEGRQEKLTSELVKGDILSGSWKFRHVSSPSPFGIAHGFTFGDGNLASNGSQVTFHGHKDAALKQFFDGHITSHLIGARKDGIPQPRAIGLPKFFKQLPSLDEAPQYLYGWLAGYFAADGCVTTSGKCVLSSSKRENLEFVRTVCTNLGIFTFGIRRCPPGSFASSGESWEVTISGEDLTPDFFLIQEHRNRYVNTVYSKKRTLRHWTVVSVEDAGFQETYCAVVPETHNFVLADHILTGNCIPQGQEIWVLGQREYVLLWSPERAAQGRLVREMPPWAIRAEHFGLDPSKPPPESIDYYTMQGKKGRVAFLTGVRANESMIRYRACVQKLHENYINTPFGMKKSIPLKFAKVIYDWVSGDVIKFITEEHGAKYCEYYDLAAITGSNTRVGIPLHAVAIRRIGDVIATEPEFYDRLYECFPHIDAQRRWWPEFDLEKLIDYYTRKGWDGVKQCIEENMLTPGIKLRAKSFAAEFRRKHQNDPGSYPLHWLIRNLLIHELHGSSVTPIGPKTKAYAIQEQEEVMVSADLYSQQDQNL
jgi:predicted phosphoadenosine phosphosulfate sulfurtransferase